MYITLRALQVTQNDAICYMLYAPQVTQNTAYQSYDIMMSRCVHRKGIHNSTLHVTMCAFHDILVLVK